MGRSHIGGREWIKGNKKFLYYFEILAVVFELEKETSKPMRLSCAARIRRTTHTRAATRRKRQVALRCLAQLGMAVLCVFHHIAPTLSKNVILAEVFLNINHVI